MPRTPVSEKLPIVQLIPNILTILAICMGMTAIRFAVQGEFEWAVRLVLIAAILDGLDGRIARLLGSDSKMGAELDSLADFLNFGVATGLIVYFWALEDLRGFGWLAVLIFAVCCVLRLARFNVARKDEPGGDSAYFIGVPSPAGAGLAMMPLFIAFALGWERSMPSAPVAIWIVLVGLAMISNLPTWSFKKTRIPSVNVKYFLVGVAVVGAAVVTFAWETLVLIGLSYLVVVGLGLLRLMRVKRSGS